MNVIYWFNASNPQLTLLLNLYSALLSSLLARLVLHLKVAHQDSVQQHVVNTTRGESSFWNEASRRRRKSTHDRGSRIVPTIHVETNVVTFPAVKAGEEENDENWDRSQAGPQIPLKRMDSRYGGFLGFQNTLLTSNAGMRGSYISFKRSYNRAICAIP